MRLGPGGKAVFSLATAAAVGIACVWACLPNLEITPTSQPASFCGDGIINPDAGEQCDPGDAHTSACEDCGVSCVVGTFHVVNPTSHHCYFYVGPGSLTTAAASCEGNGGHIVRFVSQGELDLVASVTPASPFWVGLKEDTSTKSSPRWLPSELTSEPGTSAGCAGCFAEDDGGAIPASLAYGAGNCVIATLDASVPWTQSVCESNTTGFGRETMCEREPVGTRTTSCPYGACFTVAATVTSKRYVLLGSSVDAVTAFAQCQTVGGQLAVFQSREEREQIGYEIGRQTVIDAGASDYWIGLAADGGVWAWDGPEGGLEPPPWAVNEPQLGGSRAYVIVQPGTLASELALVENGGGSHFPLCQY